MHRLIIGCSVVCVMICTLLPASAETWTDTTGKFSIDAKFQGVEGKSIILLKPNGQKITVPIAKLSPQSKAQAKSLYQAMIRAVEEAADSDASSASTGTAPMHATRSLNFQPPTPPAVSKMPAFPDGLSLEQTIAFIETQVLDGHLEVVWYALPDEMRKTFDDPRLRKAVNPFVNEQQPMISEAESLVFEAIEVLVTQKKFVLGSQKLAAVPAEILPLVRQGYDPAVGVAYELADFGFSFDPEHRSVSEMVDYHLPRIGAHLKDLLAVIPEETRSQVFAGMTVEQIDDDHAVIHIPNAAPPETPGFDGPTTNLVPEDIKMVRVAQRWVPEAVVNTWEDLRTKLDSGSIDAEMKQVQAKNAAQTQGVNMMFGMFKAMIKKSLDGLLAAKTQQEFDDALSQQGTMQSDEFGEIEFTDGSEMEFQMGMSGMSGGDQPLPEASGPVPQGWTLDLQEMTIPDKPAVAYFLGKGVEIADASLENGILELWGSDQQGHFNDNGFIIFLFLEEGESIEGKTFAVTTKTGFGSPHVHRKLRGDNMSATEMMTGGYAMKLEFGKAAGGKLPGKIYLCLPDKERSMVRGTFTASVDQ